MAASFILLKAVRLLHTSIKSRIVFFPSILVSKFFKLRVRMVVLEWFSSYSTTTWQNVTSRKRDPDVPSSEVFLRKCKFGQEYIENYFQSRTNRNSYSVTIFLIYVTLSTFVCFNLKLKQFLNLIEKIDRTAYIHHLQCQTILFLEVYTRSSFRLSWDRLCGNIQFCWDQHNGPWQDWLLRRGLPFKLAALYSWRKMILRGTTLHLWIILSSAWGPCTLQFPSFGSLKYFYVSL